MDTDWCLTCDRHIEGNGLYCSTHCQSQAGPSSYRRNIPLPSSSVFLDSDEDSLDSVDSFSPKAQWIGNGSAGIMAWAAAVPSGAPIDDPILSSAASVASTTFRAPKLLRPNRPVPPALCMSSSNPAAPSPARPISTAQTRNSNCSTPISSADQSKTSLRSDSSVSTPSSSHPILISNSRKPDIFASIAHGSWVSPSPPPSAFKHTIPPLVHRRPEQNFAVLTRTTRSSALNNIVCSSSQTSLEDNTLPFWWVSGTVADAATKGASRRGPLIHDEQQPPYRARGRRASRVAA